MRAPATRAASHVRAPRPVRVQSWIRGFRPDAARITRAASAILEGEDYPQGGVSIAFVGDEEMARVNAEFRGKAKTTDVLSFDLSGSPAGLPRGGTRPGPVLGEILVSVPRATEQALDAGATLGEEVARLVIHGLLHLAGYDHMKPGERRVMRRREAHWFAASSGGRGWVRTKPRRRAVR